MATITPITPKVDGSAATESETDDKVDAGSAPHGALTAEFLPDPVIGIDSAGILTYINERTHAVLGYTPGEVIGKPMAPILGVTLERALGFALAPCGGGGCAAARRVQRVNARHKDGHKVPLELSWSARQQAGSTALTAVAREIGTVVALEEDPPDTGELVAVNTELEVLHKISSTLIHNMELDALLQEVLQTITDLEGLKLQRKGGIFLLDGDRMHLRAHIGHSEHFLREHDDMRVGQCLCGIVASSGEIMVARNCHDDPRHTIRDPSASPHGHVILPLKAHDRVLGVLYLYLPADTDLDGVRMQALSTIGNQIGMAIENSRLYESTKAMALHDPLTGLANRRLLDIFVQRTCARAKRAGHSFSLIILDIDHFKSFNDRYGHTAGDQTLQAVAASLQETIREADLAARYGGEEFMILLPEVPLYAAKEVAERIRLNVERDTPVTVSLGVAAYLHDRETQQALIDRADAALYQAKRNGRNRCELSQG